METNVTSATEPAMTLTELAAYLSVSNQALDDLRSQGRGPRGFRVGRRLRFRMSEIEAWLARMEAADPERHRPRGVDRALTVTLNPSACWHGVAVLRSEWCGSA